MSDSDSEIEEIVVPREPNQTHLMDPFFDKDAFIDVNEEMTGSMRNKVLEILFLQMNEEDHVAYDLERSYGIPSLLCLHLKLFMCSIIRCMSMYKKKYLFYSPLLNKRKNPRSPQCIMSTEAVYESTPFTIKDFLKLLRANERLIPRRPLYNIYMERLLNHQSVMSSLEENADKESEFSEEINI